MGTSDHGVSCTARDAAVCKQSMQTLGYAPIDSILQTLLGTKPKRRLPLIHRGYWLRTMAIESCLSSLQYPIMSYQILSIGAGLDTRLFTPPWSLAHLLVEVDAEDVVAAKQKALAGHLLPSQYHLCAVDLGNPIALQEALRSVGWDPERPTIILAECVLAYLPPSALHPLLSMLSAWHTDAVMISFDPLRLNDVYGKTLLEYFRVKGCSLRDPSVHLDIHHRQQLWMTAGWTQGVTTDLNDIYQKWMSETARCALLELEPFDEGEEWYLYNAHYALSVMRTKRAIEWPTGAYAATFVYLDHDLFLRPVHASDHSKLCTFFKMCHENNMKKYNKVHQFITHAVKKELVIATERYALSKKSIFLLVVHPNDGIVGCGGFKNDGQTAFISHVAVHPSWQKKGVGSKLCIELEKRAKALEYTTMVAETFPFSQDAFAFYLKNGYHKIMSLASSDKNGLDRWEKTLTNY